MKWAWSLKIFSLCLCADESDLPPPPSLNPRSTPGYTAAISESMIVLSK